MRYLLRERGLRVHFLGQPRFFVDGEPFTFRARPRALALMAFLLLHRDAHLTRDVVAFSLWPDESEEDARTNLRRHLHLLGQALPPRPVPYVRTLDDTLSWNADAGVWFDADAFAAVAADHARAAEAVAFYGGDLLPTVFDDWIFPIRDRLARTYVSALERLVVDARSRRDFPAASAYAGRILTHDAWREDAVRHLASVRYEVGDRAGALRLLDDFAQRLQADLGVEPMPETSGLRSIILRGGALLDGVQADPAAPVAENVFPFVGRARESESLLAAWRRAARGRGEAIFVGGEAGIGKTRLTNELALRASAQGARILRGSTSSPEREPYQALIEGLNGALASVATLDVRPIWLAALVPLAPEFPLLRDDLPALPVLAPEHQTARLFEALASTLNGLARRRPLVLIVEDLHWAGAATLSALAYLVRRVSAMPVLILATYRPDEGADAPALQQLRRTLQRENAVAHIALHGLHATEVCELAATLPAFAERSAIVGAEVHAVSSGNPLFAGELLRERAEYGDADEAPRGLQSTLALRLGRLSEPARDVAEIASVAGQTCDVDFVREVAGGDEGTILDGLSELLDRNIVRELGRSGFSFAFTHELMASVVYTAIDSRRRAHLHRRVAHVSERLSAGPETIAATLAYHYDHGGDARRAATWYTTAARQAFRVFANSEALEAVDRGLRVVDDETTRRELLGLHEAVAARLGLRDVQAADIDALEELAQRAPDPAAALRDVLWRRAMLAHAHGELAREAYVLTQLGGLARAADDVARDAAVGRATARNRLDASRYAEASAAAEQALALFRRLGDVAGEIECLCLAAEAAVNHGTAERVRPLLEEAQRRAEAAGDPALAARASMAAAAAAIMRRDFPTAREAARATVTLRREIGDRNGEAEASVLLATALSVFPHLEEGRSAFNAAAEIFRTGGNRLKLAYLLFNRSAPEIQLGLLHEAAQTCLTALEIFSSFDDPRGRICCFTNLSLIRLLQGAPDEAKRLATDALAGARAIENQFIAAGALSNLGNAERELGERDAAIGHMTEAIAVRERLGRPATFEELSDLALAYLRFDELAAARCVVDDIERLAMNDDNGIWPHCAYWAAAQVYHAQGEVVRADTALRQAADFVTGQREAITEPSSRAAFDALCAVREITQAADEGVWPRRGPRPFREEHNAPGRAHRLAAPPETLGR